VDVPALPVEGTRAREVTTAIEATRVTTLLAAETFAREVAAARDSATLHVKDAEDRAALGEREALERIPREDPENTTMLASAHEDIEGFGRKVALLEDELAVERRAWEVSERKRHKLFEELTLLQTRGSELCHAIVGPLQVRHHLS
jgi:hypothetical protein